MTKEQNIMPEQGLKWLFFDLNSYFASVEQQENPHLRGRPVAVVPMKTDSTCAIAASYEAKAYGVKTGTKIYEAKKMCPGLICVEARHKIYTDYHHRIFAELENHIPVTKVCSIDEGACQLLGREQLPENARALAGKIRQGIWDHVGCSINCSIGIAPNRFLAKVASDMEKPNGLTILTTDKLPDALFALKLTDLPGINVNMEQRLNRAGVYSVRQFYELAPKQARSIWGSVNGERFWYALHGYDFEEQETQKRVIGHSRVLDPATRPPERAFTITQRLTVKAASRLRRYGLYAGEFALKIRTTGGERWASTLRLHEPAQDNFAFLAALQELWNLMLAELAHRDKGLRLHKTSIALYNLCEVQNITPDLFSYAGTAPTVQKQVKNTALTEAMDKINSRYGQTALQMGLTGKDQANIGTKIAFTRIPDSAEFME